MSTWKYQGPPGGWVVPWPQVGWTFGAAVDPSARLQILTGVSGASGVVLPVLTMPPGAGPNWSPGTQVWQGVLTQAEANSLGAIWQGPSGLCMLGPVSGGGILPPPPNHGPGNGPPNGIYWRNNNGNNSGGLSTYLPYLEGAGLGYLAGQQGLLSDIFGGGQQQAMVPAAAPAPIVVQVPAPPSTPTWAWVLGGLAAVAVIGGGAYALGRK